MASIPCSIQLYESSSFDEFDASFERIASSFHAITRRLSRGGAKVGPEIVEKPQETSPNGALESSNLLQ